MAQRMEFKTKSGECRFCKACVSGKHHRLPFGCSESGNAAGKFSTVMLSMTIAGILGGSKYFVSFIDDKEGLGVFHVVKVGRLLENSSSSRYMSEANRPIGEGSAVGRWW